MHCWLTFAAAGLAAANAAFAAPEIKPRQATTTAGATTGTTAGTTGTSATTSASTAGTTGTTGGGAAGGGAGGSSLTRQTLPVPTNPSFTPASFSYNQAPTWNSAAAAAKASYAKLNISDIPLLTKPYQPLVAPEDAQNPHGPYTGPSPTVVGAVAKGPITATFVSPQPANPTATTYNPDGTLNDPQPIPFQPAGGLGTNGSEPVYRVQSDFDYQSILLGLYQEFIELDLFNYIYNRFSDEDFAKVNLTASDRYLVKFMADQEAGHATLLSNLLGGPGGATPMCSYDYPFETLQESFDFAQKVTRWGESGVWGFQSHLDSREVAQLLDQSIATEGRQQLIFRQMSGLFPMPVWFETGIPQSWAWTYLAPYISSCPATAKRLAWQNFPELRILSQPNIERWNASATGLNETRGWGQAAPGLQPPSGAGCNNLTAQGYSCQGGVSQNRTIPLSYPGHQVKLAWDAPGKPVGPNNSYETYTLIANPKYVVWVSQLNVTYTPLRDVAHDANGTSTGTTTQPNGKTYEGDPMVNGTMFVGLTDTNQFYTPFNLSMINPHVAALGLYQAG